MKLLKKNIERSIKHADEKNFFVKLNKLYNDIPTGTCQGCTNCCMESVNTFYIEFLNIYKYLKQNGNLYQELLPKIIRYYFLELVEKIHCPFLQQNGKCSIYEVRPLTCRLFGHTSKREHEENYKNVLKGNKESSNYFKKKYGLEIPKEIVNYKIEYCQQFRVDKKVKRHARQSLIDNIFIIESNFFMNGMITEEFLGNGLVSWFAYSYFDSEKASKYRLEIMKEYMNYGRSPKLDEIIKNPH